MFHNPLYPRFTLHAQLLALAFVMATILGCGGSNSLGPGNAFPPLSVQGWTNGQLDPQDLKNQVLVVDMFATWCGPCAAHTPELVELHKIYSPRGVQFLALTTETKEDLGAIRQFAEQLNVPWPIGFGATQTAIDLNATRIPNTFVVDRSGKIVWNSEQMGSLERAIKQAL